MRKYIAVALALMLFFTGLWIFAYPHVQGAELEQEATQTVDSFMKAVQEIPTQEPVTEIKPLRPYPELYEAMREYNRELYRTKQSGLKGRADYEASPFRLTEYGLAEEVFGVISVPALEVELPLYLGANSGNMAKGAAVLGQTSIPIGGENTNAVIAGHRGWNGADYFRHVDRLQPGDEIFITNLWETLRYQVTGIGIIAPNDVEAIHIRDGKDMLTLLTCHPYASGGRYRYLVFCERVVEP